jgi:uncharacterized Zn finger protein (UPF0148 family)
MTTPSQILDEAGDETEACPECGGSGRYRDVLMEQTDLTCPACNRTGRVPKPKAEQPSAEVVERGARIVYEDERTRISWPTETWEQLEEDDRETYRHIMRAALSAIPQPADVAQARAEGFEAARNAAIVICAELSELRRGCGEAASRIAAIPQPALTKAGA